MMLAFIISYYLFLIAVVVINYFKTSEEQWRAHWDQFENKGWKPTYNKQN